MYAWNMGLYWKTTSITILYFRIKKNSKNKSFMFHFISKMQCNCISFTSNRATHRSRDIDGKPYFNLKIVPRSPLYQSKQPFSLILDIFRLKKAPFWKKEACDRKKLLGSNRPYMSYTMKFTFYLHRAYGFEKYL